MRKFILLLLVALVPLLGACNNHLGNTYDQVMKEGRQEIHDGNFAQAADYFKQALILKKGDATARALYTQANALAKGKHELKEHQFMAAIQDLNRVITQRGGSGMLIKEARTVKNRAEKMLYQPQTGSAVTSSQAVTGSSSQPAASGASATSGESASASSAASASTVTVSGDSGQSGSSSTPAASAQQKAELAVAAVAGYSPDKLFFLTTDNGAYYSIELRENHNGNSAADPDTAPSLGFFRYYKSSGKIMQLDIVSNKYQEVK
ncbi:MAG: hypothetical protein ABF820_00025 [Sporolactobacillus sp.]